MAAPIHAPGGSVAGAIDITTSVEHGDPHRLALAAFAAHSVEQQLAGRAERSRRVEAERALALLDAFLASAPVGFAFLDRDLRYVRINDVLARMNGLPVAAHIGRRIDEIVPPAVSARLTPHLSSVLATGQPPADLSVSGAGEGARHYRVAFYPVRDDRGDVIGVGSTVVDLTEARQREQALARTVSRLDALIRSDLLGIATADRDRIVDANDAFLRMVGRTRADLAGAGLSLRALTPSEYVPADDEAFRQLVESGVCAPFEKELLRPDGTRVPVILGAARLAAEPLEWIAFAVDITERRRIEAEYREALVREQIASFAAQDARREAEAANRAKDYFLATLSHELRTPIGAIVSWVRLLRSGRLPADRAEAALESVDRNLAVVSRVIDDLLDVSRAASGKLHLEWTPVELAKVIQGAVDTARAAAVAKGVTLLAKLADACPPIRGDASRLDQVVSNLVSNAIKFTPAGGTVEVRLSAQDGACRIEVQDTGIGIPAAFLPQVFEPFRQDRASTQGGLGLGLAVVRQIVDLHGGTVEAHSDGERRGSTFTVTLPAAR